MFHHSSSSNYLDPVFPPSAPAQSACFFDLSGTTDGGGQMPAAFFSADPFSPSSSLPSSYYPGLHRSNSALSVASDMANAAQFYNSPHHYQPPLAQPSSSPSSSGDFLDFYDGPVRRVFSTGDLQGMNGMPPSGENGSSSGKVGRYTAEERREKIDKYRSKRNQRNFHKKITYACRKTLADSRPRVRGRFARNGESEMETEAETSNTMSYYDGSQYSYSSSNNNNIKNYDEGECWQQMQAVLGTTEEEDRCGYDEDLLATFVDVFSMNLLS